MIIAILAALILPRFLAQSEKAMLAEAHQMIGAMLRRQMTNIDTGGAFVTIADNTSAATWNKIGMTPPGASVVFGAGAKFNYRCNSGSAPADACRASRNGNLTRWVQLTMTGTWTCGSDYTPMATGGCTTK